MAKLKDQASVGAEAAAAKAAEDLKGSEGTEKHSNKKGTAVEDVELSDVVKRVLSVFSDHDELYVDMHGGIFTKDTNPSLVGKAVLYKNPYFKK